MDLADHFRVIAHNWWRILLVAALVGTGVYFASGTRDDVYEAEAQLSVVVAQESSFPVTREATLFLADTYAERATTRPVVARAIEQGDFQLSVFDVMDAVTAEVSGDVGFLTITAEGPTPQRASRLANAVAEALIADVVAQQNEQRENDLEPIRAQIAEVSAQLDALPSDAPERAALETRLQVLLQTEQERETQPRNRAELVSRATPPDLRASPRPLRDALLGFLVAFVVAAEVSVALEALGDRLPRSEDPDAIARLFGLPVLATVPRGSDDDRSVVEAFRTLRTSLAALPADYRPRTLAVASAQAGVGKSFTAINLARASAAQQSRVLLVDTDLRRPVIHERLDISREPGLTDVLTGGIARGALHSVGVSAAYAVGEPRRFLALPSGPPVPDPVVVLSQGAVQHVLAVVEDQPQLAIFDTPPATLFGDATAVAAQCDAVVVIIDSRRSRVRSTRNIITVLTRSGANIIGLVVNRVGTPRAGRYYESA